MRSGFLFILFLFAHDVFAAEFLLFPILGESRYQRNQDQQLVLRPHAIFSVGVDVQKFSFLLERSQFQESYGSSPLTTDHQQTSYLLLGRYSILENRGAEALNFQILPSLGFGFHQDRVVTRVFSSESTDTSAREVLVTAGLVARGRISFFIVEVEARIFSGKLLDPSFAGGGVLRAGFIY